MGSMVDCLAKVERCLCNGNSGNSGAVDPSIMREDEGFRSLFSFVSTNSFGAGRILHRVWQRQGAMRLGSLSKLLSKLRTPAGRSTSQLQTLHLANPREDLVSRRKGLTGTYWGV
jgi:hypothetical protein